MSKSLPGRRWAIPLAALPALAAIAFAFALGPAPAKYVFDFEHHRGPAVERRAILEAGGPKALRILVREARRAELPHRTEALDLLVQREVPGTMKLLERIADDEDEAREIREQARSLLRDHVAAR